MDLWTRFRQTSLRTSAGFSLLEIMVSLFVLSIGLLGLAALQTTTLHYNHSGHMRSIAVSQAYGMADRMRANIAGVDAGLYNNLSGIPSSVPSCNPCTPAQQQVIDLFLWNSANATLLPTGQGTITVSGNVHTITMMWDNHRTGATGTTCSGDPSVDLTCVRLSMRIS